MKKMERNKVWLAATISGLIMAGAFAPAQASSHIQFRIKNTSKRTALNIGGKSVLIPLIQAAGNRPEPCLLAGFPLFSRSP